MWYALFHLLNDTVKNPFFDWLMPVFSDKDFIVIPGVVATVLILYAGRRRARTCMLALVLALLLSDTGSEKVIKNLTKAPRPYAAMEGVHLHRGGEWIDYDPTYYEYDSRRSYGFPSSHAANIVAVTIVLYALHRRTLWFTAPLVVLVGFSRIYTGDHFPYQVIGGYVWGALCGLFALKMSSWAVARRWGPLGVEASRTPVPVERRVSYFILAGWALMNFVFIHLPIFDLSGDEAQYWDWSRRIDLGYYSKPPLIAYLIDALTGAGGNNEWAIRSGAVLLSTGALGLVYALTVRIARNERAALIAGIAAMAMPLTWAGSILMTVDPLLIFFWLLAMYAFHRAVAGDPGMWALTGLAMGLGLLSKYTMLVLILSLALYLVLCDRRWLRTPGPYLALGIASAMQCGVLYWNWTHDWVSFRHTAAIGAGEGVEVTEAFKLFGEYFAGQVGVVSPILLGLLLWAIGRRIRRFRHDRDAAFLVLCFGVLLVFYTVASFTRSVQPNWPAAAWPVAAVALGWQWGETRPHPRWVRGMLVAGVALGCLIGVAARSTDLLYLAGMPIDPESDPTNELRGARELGEALDKYAGDKKYGPFLFSDRYQISAWMAFYGPGRPYTYCAPFTIRRKNQYDLWGGWGQLKGRDGIFVTGDRDKAEAFVALMVDAGWFDSGKVIDTVEVRCGGALIKTFTISRLENYCGKDLPPPEGY